MKLYGYWRSSASWRVRWALNLKGLAYEYVPVNILSGENRSPEHLARNPLGALPVLEVAPGEILSESLAMFEWMEETYPQAGVSLFPGTPLDRARIRSLCEIINSGTAPLQTPRVQKRHSDDAKEREAWAAHFIREGLDTYEKLSRPWRGAWSVGDAISAADLCLVPQIYNALRYGLDMARDFPALDAIYRQALATETCAAASPEKQEDAP
jgi:maleylacetoacetate isomerase